MTRIGIEYLNACVTIAAARATIPRTGQSPEQMGREVAHEAMEIADALWARFEIYGEPGHEPDQEGNA